MALRTYRDRIVNLETEKKELGSDVKDLYAEAKSQGFDVKALRRIVKETMMDQTQRAALRETESIADVYRASLGMLDGTPLGDAARRRFEQESRDPDRGGQEQARQPSDGSQPASAPPSGDAEWYAAAPDRITEAEPQRETSENARTRGRTDHAAGRSILQNPYSASDPLRADWDEGWCDASGSDGMDVPEAWRRRSPPADQPVQGEG